MSEIVIQSTRIRKKFGRVEALKGLDIQVNKNSIYGFIGPNGAGKTTFIKILLGLKRPSKGECQVLGRNVKNDTVEIRRRTGYLTQKPSYYTKMSVREVLRFSASFYFNGPKDKIERRIDDLIELVELGGKDKRPIRGFSGGEIQRLGIAQALINNPELIILDEPAASLDPLGRHQVLSLLEKVKGMTTVFYSTHILSDVERVSDTVGVINEGRLIAQAPIDVLKRGRGDTVYIVEIEGDTEGLAQELEAEEWITGAVPEDRRWHITVSDEERADEELLRKILSHEGLKIFDYTRKKTALEDIFIDLVKGVK